MKFNISKIKAISSSRKIILLIYVYRICQSYVIRSVVVKDLRLFLHSDLHLNRHVNNTYFLSVLDQGQPLWSSAQSSWLQIQRSWVRSPALPDFLRSSGSVSGSTQPRENN
jgi:hypothetical protein